MLNINHQRNEVILHFNEGFYPRQVIEEALKDFKKACHGTIEGNKNIKVILVPKEKKILNNIGFEFYNYALALIKNKGLV